MNNVSVDNTSAVADYRGAQQRTNVLWVAWRQQRFQVLTSLALVGAAALGLVIFRLNLVGALAELGFHGCAPLADDGDCAASYPADIPEQFSAIASLVPLVMLALPPLLGVLAGGPLFAREYEQGTQILSLTQAVGPAKWWASKTAVAGLPVAGGLLALGLVNEWALAPMSSFAGRHLLTPSFQTRGITPAAYFILAFAIAVTAGIVLRNTAAAIGLTVAIYVVFLLLFGIARPHYATPEQWREAVPADSSTAQATDAGDSWQLDYYYLDAAGDQLTPRTRDCPADTAYEHCLAQQGVVGLVIEYHPADRFWRFQATEAALALAASAALFGAGLARLRRRIT
ncbi:MAG: ABC transporter permease [Nakamurella sp.]